MQWQQWFDEMPILYRKGEKKESIGSKHIRLKGREIKLWGLPVTGGLGLNGYREMNWRGKQALP